MIDPVWALGDYAVLAERISDAAELLVERAAVEAGMDVLDVATGTGNAALPAVERGARVTGVDLVPELLDMARERAAELGFEVDWVEGAAEELPFPEAAFDRVLSTFGHMFAPHPERAAAELVRVCRPGGVIGFCAWTPEGWGSESHVRELLGDKVSSLEFERHVLTFEAESSEAARNSLLKIFGAASTAEDGTLRFEQEYLLTVAHV